jgi:hypothetical protein
MQFQTDKPADDPIPVDQTNTLLKDPVINPNIEIITDNDDVIETTTDIKPEIAIIPIKQTEEKENQAVSTGTNQTIQPDVIKPNPTPEQLTDPTQKPNGEKIEVPAVDITDRENKPPDTLPPATEKPQTIPNQPQAGDKQNGQIYVPGFGWIEDNGGGGQGIQADDMYENGNKIGIMK